MLSLSQYDRNMYFISLLVLYTISPLGGGGGGGGSHKKMLERLVTLLWGEKSVQDKTLLFVLSKYLLGLHSKKYVIFLYFKVEIRLEPYVLMTNSFMRIRICINKY